MSENDKLQSDLEKLKSAISALDVPKLDVAKKMILKSRVMEQVSLHVPELEPSVAFSVRVKERVFAYIEDHAQRKFFISNFFAFHKRLVASALVVMMAFTFFNYVNVNTQVVYAESFTVFDNVAGDVDVLREGEVVGAYIGMELFEKDKVVTGEGSVATIRFFDDTVSRLAERTEVRLEKLAKFTGGSAKSSVLVAIDGGEVWSRVVNLADPGSAFVVEAEDLHLATRRGAFDVRVNDSGVEVGVYSHSLKVSSGDMVDEVMSGEKVVRDTASGELVVRELSDDVDQIAWVQGNLDSDVEYLLTVEKRLLAAKMESVGVVIGEDFSPEKSLREEALLFLTFDDVKKQKIQLDLAERTFVEAQIKLEDPEITEEEKVKAKSAITSFSLKVEEFLNFADEVKTTDEEYARELKDYVGEKLVTQKRGLSLTTPDKASYDARVAIEKLELLAADSEEDRAKIIAGHEAFNGEAKEIVEIGEIVEEVEKVMPVGPKSVEAVIVEPVAESLVGQQFELEEEYGVQIQGDKALDPLLY